MLPQWKQALEEEYNCYVSQQPLKPHVFKGIELLYSTHMNQLLSTVENSLQSPSRVVTASLFAKYYSYLILSGSLYSMSHLRCKIDLSLSNLRIETDELWTPILVLEQAGDQARSSEEGLRARMVRTILSENIQPVFRHLHKLTGIPLQTLWSHASYSIHWLYDKWIAEASDGKEKERFADDFSYLISKDRKNLFSLEQNPLRVPFKSIEHPLVPEQKLRLRHKCCLRYCLPGGANCTTCPLLDEEKRKESLLLYSAKS